jgi:CrcB protein
MLNHLWISLGGALGTLLRFWLNDLISTRAPTFPLGTLAINVLGSFLIGIFAIITLPDGRWPTNMVHRQFFMIGICGGFTTFSAFSLQTMELAQRAQWIKAGANVVLSVSLCLLAAWIGHLAGTLLNSMNRP